MKRRKTSLILIALVALACIAHPAMAETRKANCDVVKKGEKAKKGSGECTFSEDQGRVTLVLRNDKKILLVPGKKVNKYKDKDDHIVVRSTVNGDDILFKWEHQGITVSFLD
ncbi:MAG: hypothetical protein V2I48_17800 [Xanthomonadales bacterium]|jgi:hypothetical protein|nr:hypothetical protein [Xanthomonadales bacterium]